MSGIRVMDRDGTAVLHPAIWADPDEVPIVFLVVKDGATALAHPDYVSELLYSINNGDLHREEAWDHLMIKTLDMEYPAPCHVEVKVERGATKAYFRSGSRSGIVRLRMEI